MPLDDTRLASRLETETNGLTRLGLTPIPVALIKAHKEHMRMKYCHRLSARWKEVNINKDRLVYNLTKTTQALRVTPAPKSVQRLASKVADAIPTAQFSLGYFYTDPYLKIAYEDGKIAYLALWTNRWWTKAIATRG